MQEVPQNDHDASLQESIQEFSGHEIEASGMQGDEEDMQSNASHDSIHSWGEIDGDAV